jgi:hypothetical protein
LSLTERLVNWVEVGRVQQQVLCSRASFADEGKAFGIEFDLTFEPRFDTVSFKKKSWMKVSKES